MTGAPAATVPLLHVGYYKTASTWLEQTLFTGPPFHQPWERIPFAETLIDASDWDFDPARTRARLDELARPAPGGSGATVPVVSHERLSGSPHAGGHDAARLAERLAAVFPGATVLVVVREQRDHALSCYRQYVREGGATSLRRYLHPPSASRWDMPALDPRFFCFDALVARYQALFGPDRVGVLAYEQLRADPAAFAAALCRLAAVDPPEGLAGEIRDAAARVVNPGLCGATLALKRWVNWVTFRDRLNPAAPIDSARLRYANREAFRRLDRRVPARLREASDRRLRREVEAWARGRFGPSNRRLAALTGLPLGEFGYDLGPGRPGDDGLVDDGHGGAAPAPADGC